MDLIIQGGQIVTPRGPVRANLLINEDKVAAWFLDGSIKAKKVIDVAGCFILPGLIDAHVHIREPGSPETEDFASASSAAASAGITTIIVMPNTKPPIDNVATFKEALDLGNRKSVVDFTLAVEANPEKVSEYRTMFEMGAASFEISMLSFPEQRGAGLFGVMQEVSRLGPPLGVFCVDRPIVENTLKLLKEQKGRKDPLAHAEAYPPFSEAASLSRILILANALGAHLHVRQLCTSFAVEVIQWAKRNGIKLSSEVNPHHLYLTTTDLERLGPVAKMLPPLRSQEDLWALWKGLRSGTIDMVSTDHAPHPDEEKRRGESDIWKAPSGIPGLETFLPLLLKGLHEGRIDWGRIVVTACENPAKIFGLYPRKGTLLPGADADLVIVDPQRHWRFETRDVLSNAKLTPFQGWEFVGFPVMTLLRGKIISDHRKIIVPLGTGKFVHPIFDRTCLDVEGVHQIQVDPKK